MKTPFYIEDNPDLVIDYRDEIPGDGYTNAFPFFYTSLEGFHGIAIHHTAGNPEQSVDDIAWYHINARKWAGIGYHFVITPDGKIYYVGDLGTGRAHVAGLNDEYVGVCLVGNFQGDSEPTKKQLESAHVLCKEFIDVEKRRFPNIDDWNDVVPHADLNPTACPGNSYPNWWKHVISGFAEDWKGVAEDLREKLEKCNEKVKNLKKDKQELSESLQRLKNLMELMEEKKFEDGETIRKLRLENEKIPDLKDTIKKLREDNARLKKNDFTVLESLGYLIQALKGGVKE